MQGELVELKFSMMPLPAVLRDCSAVISDHGGASHEPELNELV